MKCLNNIKENLKLIAIVLVLGIVTGLIIGKSGNKSENTSQTTTVDNHNHESEAKTWTCSMHPQIKKDAPGKCPICGMELIPLERNSDEENIDPAEVQMTESAMKLAEIQTMTVKKDYSNKEVYLLGKIKPDERRIAELTARYGGRIEKLHVNFTGQNVRKGEKLATIYSPELITAQKELLEAAKYKETNPNFYRVTRSKLKLWDLTDKQIDEIEKGGTPKNYFEVLSPISGTVTRRYVAIGDYVKEGDALFQVIDLTKVWAMFEAYESDLPWLNVGDKVEFTVQSVPGKKFNGKVTYIDPFLNPKTRIANVRVDVNNSKLQLKPEMYINGIIKPELSKYSKALLIPKTAVLWTGKRSVVYVKIPEREHTSFKYREITLGPVAGEFYIVEDGLKEGEEIAVNGVFKIDAAAQLEGKPSMMNPSGGKVSTGHNHAGMDMDNSSENNGTENAETEKENMNMDETETNSEHSGMDMSNGEPNVEHANIKVAGNCEMCKERIEKAAKSLDGVNFADWNIETKMLHLSFNKQKVSLDKIEKTIANVGHDTEKYQAPDDVYNALPECCKYTR